MLWLIVSVREGGRRPGRPETRARGLSQVSPPGMLGLTDYLPAGDVSLSLSTAAELSRSRRRQPGQSRVGYILQSEGKA